MTIFRFMVLVTVWFVASLAVREPSQVGAAAPFRPTSYVMTVIRESRPGVVRGRNIPVYPPYPLYRGLTRLRVDVSWHAGRWREADRWLVTPPPRTSSLARLTTAPLPSITGSGGHRIWLIDPRSRTVTLSSYDPAGTWPATEGSLKEFTGLSSPAALLANRCTRVTHLPDARIAGRPVSVLGIGQSHCRPIPGDYARGSGSRLMDGRRVVWIDKRTSFTLRSDQYAVNQPHHLMLRTLVTSIRYNVPINPALFRVSVPHGYRLIHGR